jgi:hypothetical protein
MVSAFRNNTGTIERPTNKTFKKMFADGATYYQPIQFERQSHLFLADTIGVQKNGFWFPSQDTGLREEIYKTRHYTFAERWESMLKLLSVSKTTCIDALKGEKQWTVIGSAAELLETAKRNKKSNDRRGIEIKEARLSKKAAEEGAAKKPTKKKSPRIVATTSEQEDSVLAAEIHDSDMSVDNHTSRKRSRGQMDAESEPDDTAPSKRVRKTTSTEKHAAESTTISKPEVGTRSKSRVTKTPRAKKDGRKSKK